MTEREIPLFPLHTVLFPDGPLPLRIFEPRYLDMISQCLKQGCEFGVVLITEGEETGKAATTSDMGTLARIHDWHMRHDRLLGITCVGTRRFRILSQRVEQNQLIRARVQILQPCRQAPLPEEYWFLTDLVREIIERMGHYYAELPTRYDDAGWLSFRLAELLPLRLSQKQYFLQLDDPVQRLERLAATLESVGEI